ncbi:MAG: hypothetical protein ACLUR5_15800 [Eubacterium ventriosum]
MNRLILGKSQLNQKLIEFQSQEDGQDIRYCGVKNSSLKTVQEDIKQVTETVS